MLNEKREIDGILYVFDTFFFKMIFFMSKKGFLW